MKVGLISCTKKKEQYSCKAEKMYSQSALFRYALNYCKKHYDQVYILSAKYGLIELHQKIEPYDLSLKAMKKEERIRWANKVAKALRKKLRQGDTVYFHAGRFYREDLIPLLKNRIKIPLKSLGIGKQLRFYSLHA